MTKNVEHQFDLRGLKSGETFLGCPKCWFRFDPDSAARAECPECHAQMNLYTMTDADVIDGAG